MDIKEGQKWRLKNDHSRIATVLAVDNETDEYNGYVTLERDWVKKYKGCCIDVFLNKYEQLTPTKDKSNSGV